MVIFDSPAVNRNQGLQGIAINAVLFSIFHIKINLDKI